MATKLRAHFRLTEDENRALAEAKRKVEMVETAIRNRVAEDVEYKAMMRLYASGTSPSVTVNYQNVEVIIFANEVAEATPPVKRAPPFLEGSLVNTLLNGKLLTDKEKRQLVEIATHGQIQANKAPIDAKIAEPIIQILNDKYVEAMTIRLAGMSEDEQVAYRSTISAAIDLLQGK